MSDEHPKRSDLWEMAESLSKPTDATMFFQQFVEALARGEFAEAHARAILNTGLQTLMTATQNDPDAAGEIIIHHILPICLEQDSSIDKKISGYDHLREFTAGWIEQYPDDRKIGLRKRILAAALNATSTLHARAALWTISAIGLRAPEIEDRLARLSKLSDALGDTAITCLIGLQPQEELKTQLVRKILRRLPQRPIESFNRAIQESADPRFIRVLNRRLSQRAGDSWHEVSLLGRIADGAPGDQALQERIWRILNRALQSNQEVRGGALIAGNGIAACTTSKVIPGLLACLEVPSTNASLVYNRLKECVRPEQLEGWGSLDRPQVKRTLTVHATLPGSQSRSMTPEAHIRGLAWETALSAGITDIRDWLATVLDNETSQYGQQDVLSFASYLRLATWPEKVNTLVRDRIDLEQGGSDPLIARLSATQVLRGTASKDAFETLLNCGLTVDGAPLRSTAEAVARLAERVSEEEPEFIISRLLAACESRTKGALRMLAVAGLQKLASVQKLPNRLLDRLLSITQDESLPPYATAAMIWCVSWFPDAAADEGFVAFLTRQIDKSDVEQDIKFQSIQGLIHLEIWSDYEEAIFGALDLHKSGDLLLPGAADSYQSWQAHILVLLFAREPQRFLAALKNILSNADGPVVHVMLRALTSTPEAQKPFVAEIGLAAIERTLKILGRSFGETDNFDLISDLAPQLFVAAPWEDRWAEWMPAVRAALADSLQAAFTRLDPAQQNRVFELLEVLLSDSTYQVRRAAARSYSRIDPGRLERLCNLWIHSGQTELRLRAAEMAQWLSVSDHKHLDNEILRKLKSDPEPSVRAASIRSRNDIRQRVWSTALLARVLSGDRTDGNKWLADSYCYGRALTAVGDDETIKALQALRSKSETPPNIQNWLEALIKILETHWRDVTRKWPEPWLPWSGQLEEVEGMVTLGEKHFEAKLSLWYRRQEHPTDIASWGGSFVSPSPFDAWKHFTMDQSNPVSIAIESRRTADIWLSVVGIDGHILFVGTGPYPDHV